MIKHTLETEWSTHTVEEIQYEDPGVDALKVTVPYAGHEDRGGKLRDAYNPTFNLERQEVEFLHRVFGEWLKHTEES